MYIVIAFIAFTARRSKVRSHIGFYSLHITTTLIGKRGVHCGTHITLHPIIHQTIVGEYFRIIILHQYGNVLIEHTVDEVALVEFVIDSVQQIVDSTIALTGQNRLYFLLTRHQNGYDKNTRTTERVEYSCHKAYCQHFRRKRYRIQLFSCIQESDVVAVVKVEFGLGIKLLCRRGIVEVGESCKISRNYKSYIVHLFSCFN